jgi:hypothetical protein
MRLGAGDLAERPVAQALAPALGHDLVGLEQEIVSSLLLPQAKKELRRKGAVYAKTAPRCRDS